MTIARYDLYKHLTFVLWESPVRWLEKGVNREWRSSEEVRIHKQRKRSIYNFADWRSAWLIDIYLNDWMVFHIPYPSDDVLEIIVKWDSAFLIDTELKWLKIEKEFKRRSEMYRTRECDFENLVCSERFRKISFQPPFLDSSV